MGGRIGNKTEDTLSCLRGDVSGCGKKQRVLHS
jgi:hypothetical protein